MSATTIVLQPSKAEGLGLFAPVLRRAGLEIRAACLEETGHRVPELDGAAGVVVLGGPCSLVDTSSEPFWVRGVCDLLEIALKGGTPILGICLGSQLLAKVLGSTIGRGDRWEVGWHDVYKEAAAEKDPLFSQMPMRFVAFHWHRDVHTLPDGARCLARSEQTRLQAFAYGDSAYGLLYHGEVGPEEAVKMLRAFPDQASEAQADTKAILNASVAASEQSALANLPFFQGWTDLCIAADPPRG